MWKGLSPTNNTKAPAPKPAPMKAWDSSPVTKKPAAGSPRTPPFATAKTSPGASAQKKPAGSPGSGGPAPATPISPFYSNKMTPTTPQMSAAAKMFRHGAEKIVLDREKQDKLANLIKAVTMQKASLTEEREQAIEGFKRERLKLRSMQQKTLALYSKLKASNTIPEGIGRRDWGAVADSSDDSGDELVAPSGDGAMETAMRAIKRMRPPPDARMLMTRWAAWAANHAKTDRLVTRLRKRWYRGRAARWLRAWSRMSSPRDGRAFAAQGSARQLARRTQRRAFVTWRGICAGLAAHELALLDAGTSMLAAGSPAAGLAAIAALAKSDPSAAGDAAKRRAAVAAAIAEAGAAEDFDVDEILGDGKGGKSAYATPAGSAYATPLASPMMSAAAAKQKVAAAKAAAEAAASGASSSSGGAPPPPSPPSPGAVSSGDVVVADASASFPGTPKATLPSPGAAPVSPAGPQPWPMAPAPAVSVAGEGEDEMLKMAYERSHVAEAAVAALFGRRARGETRNVFAAWRVAAARARAARLNEEMAAIKFAQAEAEAAAMAAAETPKPKQKSRGFLSSAFSSSSSKKTPGSGSSPGSVTASPSARVLAARAKAARLHEEMAAIKLAHAEKGAASSTARADDPFHSTAREVWSEEKVDVAATAAGAKPQDEAVEAAPPPPAGGLPPVPPDEPEEEKKPQPACGCIVM